MEERRLLLRRGGTRGGFFHSGAGVALRRMKAFFAGRELVMRTAAQAKVGCFRKPAFRKWHNVIRFEKMGSGAALALRVPVCALAFIPHKHFAPGGGGGPAGLFILGFLRPGFAAFAIRVDLRESFFNEEPKKPFLVEARVRVGEVGE